MDNGTVETCMNCKNRYRCGIGNAAGCGGFEPDQAEVLPCLTCSRKDICQTYAECFRCHKKASIENINTKYNAPDLVTYARRLDEFMPIEADHVAVDRHAIRLFLGEPIWRNGRWNAPENGVEVVSISWENTYLDGIVDLSKYMNCEDEVVWSKCVSTF